MIQNKKIQDLFPEGTKVSVAVEDGTYIGAVDFCDLVGICLVNAEYTVGGFTTGPSKQPVFIPYTSIKQVNGVSK
ncbi:MAG: hypothetical protein EBT07_06735 [Actinobacteria bacterium]|nr:hypothetical protein [Actinomycetota bacterium]